MKRVVQFRFPAGCALISLVTVILVILRHYREDSVTIF